MKKILVWFYTLLLRIRYGRPVTQVLSENYGQSTLQDFRHLQKLHLQRGKSQLDLDFLSTCKLFGVIPKFLYFKSSVKNFTNSKLYLSILHKSLCFEINNKKKKFNRLNNEYNRRLGLFKDRVSWFDYNVLLSMLTKDNNNKFKNAKFIHNKKLSALGISQNGSLDANKVIFNFSDRVLSKEEEEILKLGLQFGFSESKVSFVDHFLHYEKFLLQLSKNKLTSEQFEEIASKVRSLAQEGYKCNPNKSNNYKLNLNVLGNLRQDKSIIVTKPDKGKGVVILNKTDYIEKTNVILEDESKFKKINENWFKVILRQEDKLNRLLRSIKDKLPDTSFNFLFASGSLPGVLYGLPKIHKLNCPIRPILSAIGTFNYNCAKFLVPLLNPLTQNEYTVKNSIEFAKEINMFKFSDPLFLASFDVKSLFTNIPLEETIDICLDECERLNIIPFNLTRKQFKSFLDISVKESIFIFGDQLFKQVDGVAMGSPLGPTLANLFLCYHESKWLSYCSEDF